MLPGRDATEAKSDEILQIQFYVFCSTKSQEGILESVCWLDPRTRQNLILTENNFFMLLKYGYNV